MMLAMPLIRAITDHHAGAQCCLLTVPAFAPLFQDWPALQVTAIPRRGGREFLRMLRFVRSGFERIYDLQANDRTGVLCALSGVRAIAGNHPRFPYRLHPATPWRGQSHIFERMNAVLEAAGVAPAPAEGWLPANAAAGATADAWLAEHGLGQRGFALVHAGASAARPEKRWPGFAALVPLLVGSGLPVVAVGTQVDAGINRTLAAAGAIDATGAFSIAGLAALASRARFALTNDSGPMHVIATARIPVYAFFGPSDWRRNHALGQRERVLASPDLAAIDVASVMQRLHQDGCLPVASAS